MTAVVPARRPRRPAAATALLLVLAACAGPRLAIDANAPQSRILIDGRPAGVGEAKAVQPYYGTIRIEAVPVVRSHPDEHRRGAVVVDHRADEPFTPWIFPFDFILEAATAPWRDSVSSVHLVAPELPAVPTEELPPGRERLRERERAARLSR